MPVIVLTDKALEAMALYAPDEIHPDRINMRPDGKTEVIMSRRIVSQLDQLRLAGEDHSALIIRMANALQGKALQ
jgi:hypothetical protein